MDSSNNMDSLDDSSNFPELSFNDLLDPSPIKKSNKLTNDDDLLEMPYERKGRPDDTLNTPGPKKPPTMLQKSATTNSTKGIAISGESKVATPIRTNLVKIGNNTNTIINMPKHNLNSSGTSGVQSGPILLNTNNVLPKTATQITKGSIKITQKPIGGGPTTNVSLAGKTAVRTSNGQIIYIQKTTTASGTMKPGTTTTTTMMAKPQSSHGGSKPMTIQVLRTADGNYVPIKNTTTGTNGKNTTLTLSPTSLAGKKIITSSGGKVLIKGSLKASDTTTNTTAGANTITTNSLTGVKTMVRPTTSTAAAAATGQGGVNQKHIFVQGSHGKQIIVSNQSIVKIPQKPQTTTTTSGAGGSTTTTTTGTGQIHAIQIPGKLGVQYVRVLPTSKVSGKPFTSVTTTTASSSTGKSLNTSNQSVNILNNSMPQKFTVVQKGGLVASKVQKTIVTVPTMRSLNEDKTKHPTQQQQSLIKPQQTLLNNANSNNNQSLIRKHKISDINSEIQRITTNNDNAGPPEIKKCTPNNRVVVISSSTGQPKILNNSIQQPGRVTTAATSAANAAMVQGTQKITQINSATSSSSLTGNSNNKLYTILKPGQKFEQTNSPKLYSVLKTSNTASPTTQTSSGGGGGLINKPLINKQYLLQQQEKIIQLKKQHLQNSIKSLNAATSSSSYLLPIKIKEEPIDSTATNANTKSAAANSSSLPPLTMAAPSAIPSPAEDPNDIDAMVGGVRRKHCNCSKSQCLKLYCDCFANGEFCKDCTCKDCFNNLDNEDERQRAIKSCLDRNPSAFKPKITSSRDQADMRLHNKGCNCKRSGCLKNYCECYEAKIPCSSNCKCVGCRNVEDRPDLDMDPIDPKIMATIANASAQINTQKRTYEKTHRDLSSSVGGFTIKTEKFSKDNGKSFNSSDYMAAGLPTSAATAAAAEEKQQSNFITQEVVDATIQCMITQADECEKNGLPSYQTEKMVMEELGRCLVEIIDFSIRNTDNSYSQE